MLTRYFVFCLAGFLFLLIGCEASFNVTTASLSEPSVALKVDEKTHAPLEIINDVMPDAGTLYATIKLSAAPGDTMVKVVFFFVEGVDERQIAEDTVKGQGTHYISFSLSPPADGWPVGQYRVRFYLNGEEKEQARFVVTPMPASAHPPAADQTPEGTGGYQRLNEERFGFSFEVPVSWRWQLIPNTSDYLISGPAGTDAGEISVIVQVIDPRMGGVSSLKDQMVSLVDQFAQIDGAEVVKKDVIMSAGQEAPFFIVTYPANDSRGQRLEFGHTQMGLENSPYVLLLSYSAPRAIYQDNLEVFQHLVDTMLLRPPRG